MIVLFVAGILLVLYGVGSLISPRLMRFVAHLVRGDRAEETDSGERSGVKRVFRGLGMILLGLAMLAVPLFIWRW